MVPLLRSAWLVALCFVFTSCEGPSSLHIETGGVDLGASTSVVVCAGSSIRLDVSFFSHAGSDAEFEIDEARIEPPSVMDVDIDSSGVARTHVLTIFANEPGEAILTVVATGHSTPDDVVTEELRIVVADCEP